MERAERSGQAELSRVLAILAWSLYIAGLPFWLVLLSYQNDWMVVFVEAGGLPAMALGLVLALRRIDKGKYQNVRALDRGLDWFARAAAVIGIAVSIYHYGGMTERSQWIEIGVSTGFLVGTYRLAWKHLDGYGWFFLMNLSAGVLMFYQHFTWLGWQQVASLAFVIDAYRVKREIERTEALSLRTA